MNIGVVGTGRFGALWAGQLAKRHRVVTYNRSERPVPAGCSAGSLSEVGGCDAVFLCVAISSMEPVVRDLAPHVREGGVVMDTCSVKVYPTEVMLASLAEGVQVIGTHPMFGPDSASRGVAGLPLVYSPVRCEPGTGDFWRGEFEQMGLRVIPMAPDAHDREAAFTQGVTHFIGRVLSDMGLKPSAIATLGYERLLAVMEQTCNDPYRLFVDLQQYNPYTTQMRTRLQSSLNRLLESLETRLDTDS